MDLASAVQFLFAYEASLKLAPGQKPPPPSASLFGQLSDAIQVIEQEVLSKELEMRFSDLPSSVWSDWPLCCGVDLTSKELKAARSLPPSLLQQRGLLSLFLALHSCAKGRVGHAFYLSAEVLLTGRFLKTAEKNESATFPSAHLAARVGHRLINADGTLDFQLDLHGHALRTLWSIRSHVPLTILTNATRQTMPAVPHEAAGLSLGKELAVILDALCMRAAERGSEGGEDARGRGLNGIPFLLGCQLASLLFNVLMDEVLARPTARGRGLREEVYKSALPASDPLLLLKSFVRNADSEEGRGFLDNDKGSVLSRCCRFLVWEPLSKFDQGTLGRLRPVDAHTAIRIGLEDLGRQGPGQCNWTNAIVHFAGSALHSGLVRPELILRARPQLLEGLVESLARGRMTKENYDGLHLITFLTRFPAVSFHLKKFFSRSGYLQVIQGVSDPLDCRRDLIRMLGPRAAQSGTKIEVNVPYLVNAVAVATSGIGDMTEDFDLSGPAFICDFIIRDLTLDTLREPRLSQPLLRYLSELAEDIAAPKRPHAQHGVLTVVGLGKACLAFSSNVTRGLQDIREAGSKGKGVRGLGAVGARAAAGIGQQSWRPRLLVMKRELSSLRRRALRELLPLAEAGEAALWEGVTEEEVVARLKGD